MTAFMKYKLKQIEKYVRYSELTMIEISELFGFENQFHFSRLFKAHFGKSPMQYRTYKQKNSWAANPEGYSIKYLPTNAMHYMQADRKQLNALAWLKNKNVSQRIKRI